MGSSVPVPFASQVSLGSQRRGGREWEVGLVIQRLLRLVWYDLVIRISPSPGEYWVGFVLGISVHVRCWDWFFGQRLPSFSSSLRGLRPGVVLLDMCRPLQEDVKVGCWRTILSHAIACACCPGSGKPFPSARRDCWVSLC